MKKLYISILLVAIFGVLPVGSFAAMTSSELQAQINILLEQVKSLQAQLTIVQNTTTFCGTFTQNLRQGDGGTGGNTLVDKDVSTLIKILAKEGLLNYDQVVQPGSAGTSLKATYFGQSVASAVIAFQEKYRSDILVPAGLTKGNGFVGVRTRAKLNAISASYCASQTITPVIPVVPPPVSTNPTPNQTPVIDTTPTTTPVVIIPAVPTIPGLGDVNLDGVISTSDSLRIQQYIDGLKPISGPSIANADVDGDKRIGKLDLRLIADYAGCVISVFPLGNTTATRTCTVTSQ